MKGFFPLVLVYICLSAGISASQVKFTEPFNGFINPINSGHQFDPVFQCQSYADSIFAENLGTTSLTLDGIFILHHTYSGPPQFFFDNGTDTLIVGRDFKPGTRVFFQITYVPTIDGIVTDTIVCRWDSSGVKKLYSQNMLVASSIVEHDTLSPSQTLYTANLNDTVDMSINLTSILPDHDQAFGISFQIAFPDGMLKLLNGKPSDYNSTLSNEIAPQVTNDGMGNESVHFTLKSIVPITKLSPVLTLHFSPINATDTVVPVTISNIVFWGKDPLDTLCYIRTSSINAAVHTTDSTDISNNIEVVSQASKEIVIVTNNVKMSNVGIQIFSILGVELAAWEGLIEGNSRKIFPMQSSGMYFIKVLLNSKEYIFKRVL